jgi:hypothetical protein
MWFRRTGGAFYRDAEFWLAEINPHHQTRWLLQQDYVVPDSLRRTVRDFE